MIPKNNRPYLGKTLFVGVNFLFVGYYWIVRKMIGLNVKDVFMDHWLHDTRYPMVCYGMGPQFNRKWNDQD